MSNQIKLKRGSGSNPGTSDLVVGEVALRTDTGQLFTKKDDGNIEEIGAQAGISDGDKGDITVSNSGSTFTIDNGVVTSAKIADGTIVNADVNASAAINGSKITPNFGSQNITTSGNLSVNGGQISISGSTAAINFADSDSNPDYRLVNSNGIFKIRDSTNGVDRLKINTDGHFDFSNNADFASGIDVTGNIIGTGKISIDGDGGSKYFAVGDNEDFKIYHDATGPTIFNDANNQGVKFQFKELNITEYTGSTTKLKLDTNGNVGIGTSTINDDPEHCKLVISGQSGNAAGVLIFQDTSNNEDGMIFADNGNLYIVADRDNTASGSSIIFRVDGSSQKMRLDSSGNLDVTGNVVASGDITISSSLPVINLTDTNNNSDYQIKNGNGDFNIKDVTNSANRLTIASDGTTTIAQNLIVGGNLTISGTTTTIDTTTLTVEDKNIELGKVSTPSDTTADGGGITLKGATDKTFNWIDSTDSWTSSEHIALPDNKKLQVGSSQDLQIYHIANTANVISGAGPLTIQSDDTTSGVSIQTATGGETMAKFIKNGSVELYEDNVLKAETTSDGFNVEGTLHANGLDMDDNHKILLGLGDDLQIYHNGHNIINGAVGQNLEIQTNAFRVRNQADSESMIVADADGSVELYYDNTKRLETKSDGARFTGHLYANDNEKIRLGTGHDLEIYHSGSHSFIKNTTGTLQLENAGNITITKGGTENMARFLVDGAVELYHDNSKKLETTTNGAKIESGTANFEVYSSTDDADAKITIIGKTASGGVGQAGRVEIVGESTANNSGASSMHLRTRKSNNTVTTAITIDKDQDVTLPIDNQKLRFGASQDLQIYHSGTASFISNITACTLLLQNEGNIQFEAKSGEDSCKMIPHGAVELYYDNSKKFETVSGGINVVGSVTDDGANHDGDVNFYGVSSYNAQWDKSDASLKFLDNAKLKIGTGADLQIFHDGSNSYISEQGTGALVLKSNTIDFTNAAQNEFLARFFQDGQVELYCDGNKKLNTLTNGIQVEGNVNLSAELNMTEGADAQRFIDARVGSSALTFRGTTGGDTSHQEMARFFRGGACELNHAGSKKLETTNNGIQVTGRADLSGNLIIDADSPQVRLDEADTTTSTRLLMSGGQFYLQTAASGQGTSTSAGVINLTGYNNTTASQINLKASTINLSGDLSVPANEDIRFTTGTWSGNQTKIQHHANALYIVGGTSGIWFRDPDGTNRWKISDAGHLEPLANDSYDIGSSSNRIRDLYTGDLNLSNEGSGNDVDGTWGSYTIQEGEESLFLINKRNGKKYKFNLTEVS